MKSRLDQFRAPRNALLILLVWTAPALARPPSPALLELRLADVGRFASFVDMGGVQWSGRTAKLRVLQVTEGGFKAGAEEFWGGWRHEVIDCTARTIAHAGFGSIRAGGREGPVTGDLRSASPLPAGSTDEAVAKVVCDGWKPFAKVPVASSVEAAVAIGRPLIETGAEP
ncbi:hypothetical protein [Caulobacter sp. 602-1]|uniref:hypothetical protein n=1 Tax=Caulobacter sp. 602-1 TaxID=2492472 RepID=UPI000F640BB0|nr:hypothetical protein [Caulobacter sp. 602-1]RRN62060.1 hypothetical protein EIK80_23530 [Caulobacter sp. 602-1]